MPAAPPSASPNSTSPGGSVRYAGVGNISATILGPDRDYNMVSHNGTIGHEMPRVQEFVYPWAADSTMVLHSDGVSHRWDVRHAPGFLRRDSLLIAGVLYRDFDLVMPGMSGNEVLGGLRTDPRTRDIPVIVVTSKSLTGAEAGALAASNVVTVLSKDSPSRQQAFSRLREALAKAAAFRPAQPEEAPLV